MPGLQYIWAGKSNTCQIATANVLVQSDPDKKLLVLSADVIFNIQILDLYQYVAEDLQIPPLTLSAAYISSDI